MPRVAVIGGIVISVYHSEHPPPHFHAKSAEHQAVFDIYDLAMIEGFLPVAQRRVVLDWAATRQKQLLHAFAQAASHERVTPIE